MPSSGDVVTDINVLLIQKFFPERSENESRLIHAWLVARGKDFDRWQFSVRVGTPATPDPSHLPGVQRATVFSSLKRIDIVAWRGDQAYIGEVKLRLTHYALGQLQVYRRLWLEGNPHAREPQLFAVAAQYDPDVVRIMQDAGVAVYIYPDALPSGGATTGGVSPGDSETA